ncbi:Transcriptional regulator, HxlR family [Sphingomonas paucimobilis]|nr:Transcriptional regulator, HxlR family [Sphingomonas paucimobilis]
MTRSPSQPRSRGYGATRMPENDQVERTLHTSVHRPDTAPDSLIGELHNSLIDHDPARRDRLDSILSTVFGHSLGPGSHMVELLQLVGDRWSALILTLLGAGTFRPSELQRVVNLLSRLGGANDISQRVLTAKLRAHERMGLLERTVCPTVPPSTYYTLTPLGRELVEWIDGMERWCFRNEARIHAAQQNFDEQADGGE